jgi:hypothetical protein
MLFYRGMTRENVTIKATGGPRLPLMWPSRLVRVHFRAWRLSARGRWFLGEYAKRNRNADTRMVLDEVARIEQTLEALHQSTPDTRLTQILATIRNVVDQAIEMAASAADGLAIDNRLTPIRKGAKILKEISWRWREIGAESRICDSIDSQVDAIQESCRPGSSSKIVFRLLIQRLRSPSKSRPAILVVGQFDAGVADESGQKRHGTH